MSSTERAEDALDTALAAIEQEARDPEEPFVLMDAVHILALCAVVRAAGRREALRDQLMANDDCAAWPSLEEWDASRIAVRDSLTALRALVGDAS